MTAKTSHSSVRARTFPHIDFLDSLKPTRMKLDLENITRLLRILGDPQNAYPSVLIAGTNGKGSVAAFLSSILFEEGLRVGTFFSPHIFRANERIRLQGEEIPSADLNGILGALRAKFRKAPFTYFEGMTAAAALYFERKGVDMAVFEVGLGGRLDATRLVNAVVTVITGISLDHHKHLGATKAAILKEKLGIVRRGVPLVANLESSSLADAARRHCDRESASFHNVAEDVRIERFTMNPRRLVMDITTPERHYTKITSGMIGRPQLRNIATSVRTAEILARRGRGAGGLVGKRSGKHGSNPPSPISSLPGRFTVKAIRGGIRHAFVAGRFQVLQGDPRIILDVSHNQESFAASLETLLAISPRERNVLVFAVQAHKELGKFPAEALRSARLVLLATLDSERGARGEELLRIFERSRPSRVATVLAAPSIKSAVSEAVKNLRKGDSLLIFGSHLTVERAARHL
jgi:dihydrofolate synthase/folylpolyglutamate synthase